MKPHATNLIALIFGLAFVASGMGFIIGQLAGYTFDPAWVVAIGFGTVGLITLAVTLLGRPVRQKEIE